MRETEKQRHSKWNKGEITETFFPSDSPCHDRSVVCGEKTVLCSQRVIYKSSSADRVTE